ncbi:hypothetical protein EO92_01490 [Methanosarcina sp. 2.H.A.1B.4]|nr:hypothetical protein EO92_01490 [Methanosarcina sp. 2.H.A.1B.4]
MRNPEPCPYEVTIEVFCHSSVADTGRGFTAGSRMGFAIPQPAPADIRSNGEVRGKSLSKTIFTSHFTLFSKLSHSVF